VPRLFLIWTCHSYWPYVYPQVSCDGQSDYDAYAQCPSVVKGCAFWNVSTKAWSSEGCVHVPSDADGEAVCRCNHLTDFTILEVTKW
jgi:hypothetical protein